MGNKFLKTLKSTALCIRYPFLYPRNRWTGNHYDCWQLVNFVSKYRKYTTDTLMCSFVTFNEFKELVESESTHFYSKDYDDDTFLRLSMMRYCPIDRVNSLELFPTLGGMSLRLNKKPLLTFKDKDMVSKGKILGMGFRPSKQKVLYIVISGDTEVRKDFNRFIKIVLDKKFDRFLRFLQWVNNYPLQWFHCLTSYTELDAMPDGWRKAFGKQMCNELKKELKKEHYLYDLRITQIKEKFGGLRFYVAAAPKSIYDIIDKYEGMSYKICIDCGKPATKISCGWVSPYCDDCIGDRAYTDIEDEFKEEEE